MALPPTKVGIIGKKPKVTIRPLPGASVEKAKQKAEERAERRRKAAEKAAEERS